MARAKEMLFYRKEGEQDVWQFGLFRPSGVKWMRQNGWREVQWMNKN